MSEENNAATIDPLIAFVQGADDQGTPQSNSVNQTPESAPATEEKPEEINEDGFQKRINKVTSDKYAEKRRADDLQKRLDAFEKASVKPSLSEPSLEDAAIDYDEEKLSAARIAYQVQEGVKVGLANHQQAQVDLNQQAETQRLTDSFNERVTAMGKDDFNAKAGAIPELPAGVADALMQSDNGPEMIYHLGQHLDSADALSKMSPAMAMMELGKLSAKLSIKPEIKTSTAPDPIEPIQAGSALSSEINDEMSMSDWMAKFG